jgi:murein DD-endopeptidase MepM/ murein hydrolase activator NlpD
MQVVIFAIGLLIIFPYSKLAKANSLFIGKEMILDSLVPKDEENSALEIMTNDIGPGGKTAARPTASSTESWSVGYLSYKQPGDGGNQDLSQTSAGGSAITKPTIILGSGVTPSSNSSANAGRTEVVYYTVQAGDVISTIAREFDLKIATILWSNNLSVRSYIKPGDKLKILPVDGVVHKVARGDTLIKIAKKYSADQGEIASYNHLQPNGSDLVLGEEILVPNGKIISEPSRPQVVAARKYTSLSVIAAPPPSVEAPAGSGWLWPAGVRTITQYFNRKHIGLDIAGPIGTPVYASRAGTVIKSQCGWNSGYGCYIIVDHGGGLQTLYGHASELYVSVGEEVEQGQVIMAMGSTGHSTGPHVHFEVRSGYTRYNPLKYIR